VGWPKRKCGICVSGEVKTNGAEVIELAKQKVVNGRRRKNHWESGPKEKQEEGI
jgi:hypothetical protein